MNGGSVQEDADVDPFDEDPLEMEQAVVQSTGARLHLSSAHTSVELGFET